VVLSHPEVLIRLRNVGLTSETLQPPGQKRPRVQQILQPLDLEINAGDRIALVGPPGSGKTSLLRLLNRLAENSQGQIDWLGNLGKTSDPHKTSDLRRRILMVPAVSQFFGQSVRQSLIYPLALRGLSPEAQTQAMAELQDDLPKDWLDRSATTLSQGQQQRVSLVRAFLCAPQILLLDEPMSHGAQGDWLAKQLDDRPQMTVLIASQQLDWLQENVDRVIHLELGKLQTDCTTSAFDWQRLKLALKETPSDGWG
jgi:D-methionine transport system ATP-binding protein